LPAKIVLASYIVRVYRFQRNKPQAFLGVVEEVGKKGKKAFTHYDELWEILNSSRRPTFQKRPGQRNFRGNQAPGKRSAPKGGDQGERKAKDK